ncbi:MAG: T9SS type A sorting domain-containing protein [Flavipsychrobacter sp.]|nr:T9SS type A sorting domain-containing protein [Flavipsychrobacter sp.]
MKKFLSLIIVLLPLFAMAQKYACIYPGARLYFTNSNYYLRGIAIDSVKVSGTDSLFFPFKSLRSSCTPCDPSEASWVGSRIIKKPDGTYFFNTKLMDTVIIKSRALPGEKWMFYTDGFSASRYEAEVLSLDTMTFAGIFDSVKRIRLNAYIGTTPDSSDTLNGREIIISKNNGFVQIFDLYTFPYRPPVADITLSRVGGGVFTRSDYHNATTYETYDFSPGDAYLTAERTNNVIGSVTTDVLMYDSILSKTSPDPYHNVFTIQRWKSYRLYHPDPYHPTLIINYEKSIYTLYTDSTLLLPTYMPESYHQTMIEQFYYPQDSACAIGKLHELKRYIPFEGCPYYLSYKTGFPRLKFLFTTVATPWDWLCNEESGSLNYSFKNGKHCGEYPGKPNRIDEVPDNVSFSIFPNPASSKLTLQSHAPITTISIMDLSGRLVYTENCNGKTTIDIDISSIQDGLYICRINDSYRRIAIVHSSN